MRTNSQISMGKRKIAMRFRLLYTSLFRGMAVISGDRPLPTSSTQTAQLWRFAEPKLLFSSTRIISTVVTHLTSSSSHVILPHRIWSLSARKLMYPTHYTHTQRHHGRDLMRTSNPQIKDSLIYQLIQYKLPDLHNNPFCFRSNVHPRLNFQIPLNYLL